MKSKTIKRTCKKNQTKYVAFVTLLPGGRLREDLLVKARTMVAGRELLVKAPAMVAGGELLVKARTMVARGLGEIR